VVSLLAALVLLLFWIMRPLPLQSLVLEGLVLLRTEEIVQWIEVVPGNLEAVESSWKGWEARLLQHPRIRSAKVTRSREGILRVQIEEKKTAYLVRTGSQILEVDTDGVVISETELRAPDTMLITGNFPFVQGKLQGTQFLDISKRLDAGLKRFPELKNRISEVVREPDGEFLLYLKSPFRSKIYLGEELNMLQFRKLYASLGYLESQNQEFREIDLRGEDAVYH